MNIQPSQWIPEVQYFEYFTKNYNDILFQMNHADFVSEGNALYDISTKQNDYTYYQLSLAFYGVAIDFLDEEISSTEGDNETLISQKQSLQSFLSQNKQFAEDRNILSVVLLFYLSR